MFMCRQALWWCNLVNDSGLWNIKYLIMQLLMIEYMCKNEKGYLSESFNVLINVIMQWRFKYIHVIFSQTTDIQPNCVG